MKVKFERSGSWKINNIDFSGNLFVDTENKLILLRVYENMESSDHMVFLNKKLERDFESLVGKLGDGSILTLLNCKCIGTTNHIGSKNEYRFTAEYLINGFYPKDEDKILFSSATFRVTNALEWVDSPVYSLDISEFKKTHKNSITINDCQASKVIYENKEIKISARTICKTVVNAFATEKTELEQYPIFSVVAKKEGKPLSFFLREIEKIQELIKFATGEKSDICKITVYDNHFDKSEGSLLELDFSNSYEIYHTKEAYRHNFRFPGHSPFLFKLPDLLKSRNTPITSWFEKYDVLEPILKLEISSIKELPIEYTFLNYAKSLETIFDRFFSHENLSDYVARNNSISPTTIGGAVRDEFIKALDIYKKRNCITFRAKLFYLLYADTRVIFVEPNLTKFSEDFIVGIVETRNFYTHVKEVKKEKVFTEIEMEKNVHYMRAIINYYILESIGIEARKYSELLPYHLYGLLY